MTTTVNELKAYYAKIGGQASDVVGIDTIPDMIAKITAISGGGGGGAEPVYLYVLDHAIESDDTLPPIPEELSGYHWEISEESYALSLSENGTALKFGELGEIIKQGSPVYIVCPAGDSGRGSIVQVAYQIQYAENVYRWNDEENYHVCAVFSVLDYTNVGVWVNLIEG